VLLQLVSGSAAAALATPSQTARRVPRLVDPLAAVVEAFRTTSCP
jgi:hypothetical protein